MRWPKLNETQARMVAGALKGAVRGGPAGAVASIATGAAVVVTAPAWLPIIGGTTAISMATVVAGSAIGAGVGALGGAAAAYIKKKRIDAEFAKTFGESKES